MSGAVNCAAITARRLARGSTGSTQSESSHGQSIAQPLCATSLHDSNRNSLTCPTTNLTAGRDGRRNGSGLRTPGSGDYRAAYCNHYR